MRSFLCNILLLLYVIYKNVNYALGFTAATTTTTHPSFLLMAPGHSNRRHDPRRVVINSRQHRRRCNIDLSMSSSSEEESDVENESIETLRSFIDYHQDTWIGNAISFTVTQDVAAGIINKQKSPEYITTMKLSYDNDSKDGMAITETFEWGRRNNGRNEDSSDNSNNNASSIINNVVSRTTPIYNCNFDCDSVDASYSLDNTLMDMPSVITGTNKLIQFGIEHCLTTSDDERVRCFVFYGLDQSLIRIVVCNEKRQRPKKNSSKEEEEETEEDISSQINDEVDRMANIITDRIKTGKNDNDDYASKLSISNDDKEYDNDDAISRLEQIQKVLSSKSSSTPTQGGNNMGSIKNDDDDGSIKLSRKSMTIIELSNGVWLGDTIVRDLPHVSLLPSMYETGKGFGGSSSSSRSQQQPSSSLLVTPTTFAKWDIGVQKVASQLLWDYNDDTIQQIINHGRSLGPQCATSNNQYMNTMVVSTKTKTKTKTTKNNNDNDNNKSSSNNNDNDNNNGSSNNNEGRKQLSGMICSNEMYSRRIPKDERMIYIDYSYYGYVGFVLDSVSIQVPRFLTFDPSATRIKNPFYTEFCVYTSTTTTANNDDDNDNDNTDAMSSLLNHLSLDEDDNDDDDDDDKQQQQEVCCSKISRIYNYEGQLKQGCTSFFKLTNPSS